MRAATAVVLTLKVSEEPLVAVDSYDPPEASPAFQVDPAAPSSAVHPDAEPHKPDPAA